MHQGKSPETSNFKYLPIVVFVLSLLFVWLFLNIIEATAESSGISILYAAPTGQGSSDCSSWSNACRLETAVTQASSGQEVWVKQGIHYPTTDSDNISATFQLSNDVSLFGGFDGSETARSQRDWAQNLTILSGDIQKNDDVNSDGILTDPEDIAGLNSYHVVMALDVTETAVVDGFTITAGSASSGDPVNGISNDRGGALYNQNSQIQLNNISLIGNQANLSGGAIYNTNSDVTIDGGLFENNFAVMEGGAIYSKNSSEVIIIDSQFTNNAVGFADLLATGGAIYHDNSQLTASNTLFEGNSTSHNGGAIYHFSTTATYNHVEFINNSAENGGAVYSRNSTPTFNQSRFQGNEASEFGGALYNYFNSDPVLNNTLLAGNFAGLGSAGMFSFFDSDPTLNNVTISGNLTDGSTGGIASIQNSKPIILNSIIWNNRDSSGTGTLTASIDSSSATVQNSIVQGSGGSGDWDNQAGIDLGGNLDQNPQFVAQTNPANAPATGGNFRLESDSPAINAGDTAAYGEISASSVDLANNTRIYNDFIDMGAYEFIGTPDSYPLTIDKIGSGDGQILLNGSPLTCDEGCTVDVEPDTAVSLTANPDANATFAGWSGVCSGDGICQFTMNGPKSVTANFINADAPIYYTLTVEFGGSGDGQLFVNDSLLSCNGGCTVEYLENTAVTLTASPDADSTFGGWGGVCDGIGNCDIIMNNDKEITVYFFDKEEPLRYPLTIDVMGMGSGQLYLNGVMLTCNGSCMVEFDPDTAVSLTAFPNALSTFAGWGGDCNGDDSCVLTMDGPKEVSATFDTETPSESDPIIYLPFILR